MSTAKEHVDGAVKISDEVIAVCAVNAALKTEGVAGLAGGISNTLSKNFLGKELLSKGVKVSQSDGTAQIDVFIKVRYHARIPAVAWDIQENVKNEIKTMTDIDVTAVNIHVQGVEIPSEEPETNDEK